jgi:hypothetical protein
MHLLLPWCLSQGPNFLSLGQLHSTGYFLMAQFLLVYKLKAVHVFHFMMLSYANEN